MERIAICITTRNRPDILDISLRNWKLYLPKNAKIFVVDDASDIPNLRASYRFEKNVGIARAKSKCLEIAQNFDHVFLVDDDVYPKKESWHIPYINSGVNHLCLTFEKNYLGNYYSPSIRSNGEYNGLISYTAPNGCFLYLKKICIEKAGGFRPEFDVWGFEHVEYSQRIHLLGLTPMPYLDIPNSLDYIHVMDWNKSVISCVSNSQKRLSASKNLKIYEEIGGVAEYVPFK